MCSQCLSVSVIISFLLFLLFPGSSKQERYESILSSRFAKISNLFPCLNIKPGAGKGHLCFWELRACQHWGFTEILFPQRHQPPSNC